jgi:hypothetical protein
MIGALFLAIAAATERRWGSVGAWLFITVIWAVLLLLDWRDKR